MKRCPQCNSTYSDESLVFCLTDGATLVAADETRGAMADMVRSAPEPAPTEVLPASAMPSMEETPQGQGAGSSGAPPAGAAQGFVLPPPPPFPHAEKPTGPVLSTGETLTGIFFDPGRVFESFRVKSRFLAAALICVAAFLAFNVSYIQKVGYENLVTAEMEINPRAAEMSPEQKERAISIQTNPIVKAIRYGAPLLNFVFFFAIGAVFYMLGAMLMAKPMTYPQALSVWTYSSYPPLLLAMLLNIVLVFINPPTDDANIVRGQAGLVHANLSILVDPAAHPVLGTALAGLDVFAFYGLFLAALGMRKVARLSSGSAWAIVIAFWLIGLILRIALSLAFGRVIG